MEGLNTQLQKSLAENTRLEEQLKDQERHSRQNARSRRRWTTFVKPPLILKINGRVLTKSLTTFRRCY
jgi:hypothetical protein